MSSSSKSQQRLFGWVHACKKGTAKNCPKNISKIADSISDKDAEDFAKTKHDKLPERKMKSYKEFTEERLVEQGFMNAQSKKMALMSSPNHDQVKQLANQAGIPLSKYFQIMSKWMDEIENKLGVKNQESPDQWHQQAVEILQVALDAAKGGKKQWNVNQQLKNFQQQIQQPPPPQ